MAATQQVCPVVGTTNTILPPSHPDFDITDPSLKCPVTNATTSHHQTLSKHPSVPIQDSSSTPDAKSCPVLKQTINNEENKALDEGICPVVGPVSTVLPPDHPTPGTKGEVCPVTKATLKHHEGKLVTHPSVEGAAEGAVCPVAGKSK